MFASVEGKCDRCEPALVSATDNICLQATSLQDATPITYPRYDKANGRASNAQSDTGATRLPDLIRSGDDIDATEGQLVARARHGDTGAFGELLSRSHKTCLRRALSMLRNHSDAEDEVQNAAWKAFERLDQYRGDGSFAAWLTRIVENECLMRLRQQRQSWFVYLDDTLTSPVTFELVGQKPLPEEELGDMELRELLRVEIMRTPPLFRNVVLLRDVQQLPMAEVAARLGLSIPAAKSRLMRARLELRKRLLKHCGSNGHRTLTHKTAQPHVVQIRRS